MSAAPRASHTTPHAQACSSPSAVACCPSAPRPCRPSRRQGQPPEPGSRSLHGETAATISVSPYTEPTPPAPWRGSVRGSRCLRCHVFFVTPASVHGSRPAGYFLGGSITSLRHSREQGCQMTPLRGTPRTHAPRVAVYRRLEPSGDLPLTARLSAYPVTRAGPTAREPHANPAISDARSASNAASLPTNVRQARALDWISLARSSSKFSVSPGASSFSPSSAATRRATGATVP